MNYSLPRAMWEVMTVTRDDFRVVASCPTQEAADAAARLLNIIPFWGLDDWERKQVMAALDRQVEFAMRVMFGQRE